uniref:Uncharacterized protein n=1 Tax=Anopheles christyi TaxID=43041 RepID=A0A182K625_9DIPT
MDSNKNQECCYSNGGRCVNGGGSAGTGGLTVVIGTDCIAKAVSAAKYQNQFNNNNLIEQENLMPPVQERVSVMVQDDDLPSATIQQNGVAQNDSSGKEKVHLAENGSTRHIPSPIFTQSSSPVSAGSDGAVPERLHPTLQTSVECFRTSTNNITSFNPPVNGTGSDHHRAVSSSASAHETNPSEVDHPSSVAANNDDTVDPPDEGDFSDNNSLGNLSYVSENGLIEEIILLPNNVYSDDDNASTSDDCIYAYRGGEPAGAAGQLLDLHGDLPPDDETDFLEMDFDPEPSSEMENFNRQQDFLLGLDGDQFPGVALPPEGQQVQTGAGSGARSPTVVGQQGSTEQIVSVSSVEERHEQPQKVNETGLHHQAIETSEGRALNAVSSPSLASVEDTKLNTLQQSIENGGDTGLSKSPEPAVNRIEAHKTGAIPKNLPIAVQRPITLPASALSSNSKNLRLDLAAHSDEPDFVETHRYQDCSLYYYQPTEFGAASTSKRSKGLHDESETEEMHCLDCAEQEFLMHTKQDPTRQRYCNVCNAAKAEGKMRASTKGDHRTVRSYVREDAGSRTDPAFYPRTDPRLQKDDVQTVDDELLDLRAEQIVFETLHKINTLKEMPPTGGVSRAEREQSKEKLNIQPVEQEKETVAAKVQYDQMVPPVTHSMTQPEQSVTLYTVNCNEVRIAEAFMHFGLLPKEGVLRQYANERYEADDAKMTIPQYLLHMSKRNCNYKKLIDVIKSCCDMEPLDVQYYPIDPFSDEPEIVQICSSEIAKRWNANTNLRQIIHFKHKHFHTLNVLGKIVNILRQPSRGRDTNYMISIPQYYKSGIIKIRRIAAPSSW